MKISLKVIFSFIAILSLITSLTAAEKAAKPLSPGWSFKGFFGKFDRASLQRGYQVSVSYTHLTLTTICSV